MSRGKYLFPFLSKIHSRFQTPYWALIVGGSFGIISILSGSTQYLIILSVLGAVVMYIISMLSLFRLRISEPNLKRPYRALAYPISPIIATILSIVSLAAIIYYNIIISLCFIGILLILLGIFYAMNGHKNRDRESFNLEEDNLEEIPIPVISRLENENPHDS